MTAKEKKIAVRHIFSRIVASDPIVATMHTGKVIEFPVVLSTSQAGQNSLRQTTIKAILTTDNIRIILEPDVANLISEVI